MFIHENKIQIQESLLAEDIWGLRNFPRETESWTNRGETKILANRRIYSNRSSDEEECETQAG
jgi:hypothetical protein